MNSLHLYKTTKCAFCKLEFTLLDEALRHLDTTHHIEIHNPREVLSFFEEYILHYQKTQATHWGDDETLRGELRFQKVQETIERAQLQWRNDTEQACLFCPEKSANLRLVFKHMFQAHGTNVGLMDNLVDAEEFIDTLRSKLGHNICISCEEQFADQSSLRNHLRKKKHHSIDSNNHNYDKYYISNYRGDDEGEEEDSEQDWNDVGELDETTVCLFEATEFTTPEACLEHMKLAHKFDLIQLMQGKGTFAIIRLINYIRQSIADKTCPACQFSPHDLLVDLVEHVGTCEEMKRMKERTFSDDFLKPVLVDDGLLGIALDDDEDDSIGYVISQRPS
jgi:hypothetical protein